MLYILLYLHAYLGMGYTSSQLFVSVFLACSGIAFMFIDFSIFFCTMCLVITVLMWQDLSICINAMLCFSYILFGRLFPYMIQDLDPPEKHFLIVNGVDRIFHASLRNDSNPVLRPDATWDILDLFKGNIAEIPLDMFHHETIKHLKINHVFRPNSIQFEKNRCFVYMK